MLPGYFFLLEEECIVLLKMYVCFVTVYFISARKSPLSVTQAFSFFCVCLQVTHIEILRRDCGTGSLPPSSGSFPVLFLKAMIIGIDALHNSTV